MIPNLLVEDALEAVDHRVRPDTPLTEVVDLMVRLAADPPPGVQIVFAAETRAPTIAPIAPQVAAAFGVWLTAGSSCWNRRKSRSFDSSEQRTEICS